MVLTYGKVGFKPLHGIPCMPLIDSSVACTQCTQSSSLITLDLTISALAQVYTLLLLLLMKLCDELTARHIVSKLLHRALMLCCRNEHPQAVMVLLSCSKGSGHGCDGELHP